MQPVGPTYLAACANCAAWRTIPGAAPAHASAVAAAGACVKGYAPPEGEPRCDAYEISPAFQRQLVARLMQDPVLIPVPLKAKAKKRRKR